MTAKENFLKLLHSDNVQDVQLAFQLTEQNPELVEESKKIFYESIRTYPKIEEGREIYDEAEKKVKTALYIAEKFPDLQSVIDQYHHLAMLLNDEKEDGTLADETLTLEYLIVYYNQPEMDLSNFEDNSAIAGNQKSPLPVIHYSKHFPTIKKLNIDNNQLATFPKEVLEWSHLEELRLNENFLESLPSEITHLKDLKKLQLKQNHLRELPRELVGGLATIRVS